ncbi:MAG: class I SAM-dependent methyltransferase [Candidatus Cybelea sp.]
MRRVGDFYERHPYPPPADDLDNYRRAWDDDRRRADSHLFWPHEPYRDDRSILVAGCGTSQAAHYAVRWPRARVVGIDLSENSIAYELELKRKHNLDNLEVRQLAVERAGELGEPFDYVVCTGVLHHLAGPDAGLRALREVLTPHGALHLMVYAPYGRAGVYMLQDYCRHLGIGWSEREINDLAATLKTLPPDHPLVPLLRDSPDFGSAGGLADALLHPQDRAYTVAEFLGLMDRTGLKFGRWLRQAPYLPDCGAIANAPHAALLRKLALTEQFAALELLRGTMVRHAAVAYRDDAPARREVEFDNDSWVEYVPIRLPGTIAVRERLPAGAAAVLINRNHTYTDLYLPIDAPRLRLWEAIDGTRTIAEIIGDREDRDVACDFFEQLWNWDQTVFALDAQP